MLRIKDSLGEMGGIRQNEKRLNKKIKEWESYTRITRFDCDSRGPEASHP